ncbi:GDP-mannose 4,6-dehydratase, partial [Staphylococcus aureus]
WLMMQQEKAEDFVLATGITTYIRDFVKMAFREIGVELVFTGEGVNELGLVVKSSIYNLESGKEVVKVDPRYYRPTE